MKNDYTQTNPASNIADLFKTASKVLSILILLIGCAVLAGWILDIPMLKSVLPNFVTMKANTAICFVLLGLSLWLSQTKRSENIFYRNSVKFLAIIVAFIGFVTILEYLFGWNLGLDQLFFKESASAIFTSSPGRMALNTAINFLLIAGALILTESKTAFLRHMADAMIIVQIIVSFLSFVGYFYGAPPLYIGISLSTAMALHTTILFIMVGIAYLFTKTDRGIMKIIGTDSISGSLIRRLLPIAIFVPLILGRLKISADRMQLFASEFGVSLVAIANTTLIVTYICLLSRRLYKFEITNNAIIEESRQLASIVQHADDAIIGKDMNSNIVSWNKGAERIYGYSGEEAIGRNISIIIPPDRQEELPNIYERIKRGEVVEHLETVRCKKDGSCINVSLTISPITDNAGKMIGFSSIARDITENKRIQEELNKRMHDMEIFNKAAVDRELKMVELKKKIAVLEAALKN